MESRVQMLCNVPCLDHCVTTMCVPVRQPNMPLEQNVLTVCSCRITVYGASVDAMLVKLKEITCVAS